MKKDLNLVITYTYASLIENEFARENVAILSEYGVPVSAIKKIEKYISSKLNEDEVLETISRERIYENSEFIEYEKAKIIENL